MNSGNWIKSMDVNTIKYMVNLQKINKSLIKTLKIYGELLRKGKFEDENHEEIRKAIANVDKVIASAEKADLLQKATRH